MDAVISTTCRFPAITSSIEISSYFFALGFFLGSESYTPSIAFARYIASASTSTALSTTPVSVEKYGCPVPPAKKQTFPAFMDDTASSLEKSSVNEEQRKGVNTLVPIPRDLNISET